MRQMPLVVPQLFLVGVVLVGAACDDESRPAARSTEVVLRDWQATKDQGKRLHLAEEMIRDGHLIGMTGEQVERELGQPNPRRMSPQYGEVKYIVGASGVDDLWLCIHFKDGKVQQTEIRSD
jgi:hypothetical protein